MDRLALENQEKGRLISVEDCALIDELELRWSEQLAQLQSLARNSKGKSEELNAKYARLGNLRRAAHRLKQLAEADHRYLYGTIPRVPDLGQEQACEASASPKFKELANTQPDGWAEGNQQ